MFSIGRTLQVILLSRCPQSSQVTLPVRSLIAAAGLVIRWCVGQDEGERWGAGPTFQTHQCLPAHTKHYKHTKSKRSAQMFLVGYSDPGSVGHAIGVQTFVHGFPGARHYRSHYEKLFILPLTINNKGQQPTAIINYPHSRSHTTTPHFRFRTSYSEQALTDLLWCVFLSGRRV
jgi:hypothetical protein